MINRRRRDETLKQGVSRLWREDRVFRGAVITVAIGSVILLAGTLVGFFEWTWTTGPPPPPPQPPTQAELGTS